MTLALQEQPEQLAELVQKGIQERLEQPEQPEQKEIKETLGQLVVLGCRVQEDILVPQEVLVHRDLLEQKAKRGLLVLTVLMGLKETRVILDQLDLKEHQD